MQETTDLYRMYDRYGCLLYVGVSKSALGRMQSHKKTEWACQVSRIEIEKFPTRAAALVAEMKAIQCELPAHNVVHSREIWSARWWEWGAMPPDKWESICSDLTDAEKADVAAIWCAHISAAGCLDAPV